MIFGFHPAPNALLFESFAAELERWPIQIVVDGGNMKRLFGVGCVVLSLPISSWAQGARCHPTLAPRSAPPQIADLDFSPPLPSPAFAAGQGPRVFLDEGHNNFHTV